MPHIVGTTGGKPRKRFPDMPQCCGETVRTRQVFHKGEHGNPTFLYAKAHIE